MKYKISNEVDVSVAKIADLKYISLIEYIYTITSCMLVQDSKLI